MGRLKSLMGLLTVALVTSSCVGQVDWECPPSCKCIWVSGKKTTECKRLNLTDVPASLSKETQHLDLSGNLIRHLPQTVFSGIELVNLQKLVLRECGIRSIDAQAFSGLRIVIEIDLSGNRIRQLHSGTFDETERLRVILLNDNRLQKLEDGLFHDLRFLQKVQLSDNHLVQIGPHSFLNLPGLQTLALDGNNLTRLDTRSFESLPRLGSLELQRNPWQCDCHLKPFRDWAIQRKLYTQPTSCAAPAALAGRHWDEVPAEEFACLPRIESLGAGLKPGAAVLWCRAAGSPRAQLSWVHRQRLLANGTKRPYLLQLAGDWANLTVPEPQPADRGEYVCVARNFAGAVEGNVSLPVPADLAGARDAGLGLPLALGLGLLAFLFLLVALTLCLCYCRRRRSLRDEKGAEAASLDQHGLGEQEKSLITAINPVVKPPRRYEAPSLASRAGTEMTELNRTLLDGDSVFADGGLGSVVGVLPNGLHEEERGRASPELDALVGMGPALAGLPLSRHASPYRQYPPDLLAFSAGRTSSPTSQASTQPDSSRLPAQLPYPATPIGFKTLPHPVRASSATPYSLGHQQPSLPRHGYGTIPRRPRAPSWSSGPPTSPIEREMSEPVYDNLGLRTTADGSSVLSLNKSPEPGLSMRNRPLPSTPTSPVGLTLPRAPRSAPLLALQLNRSAPEGAAEWPAKQHPDEQQQQQQQQQQDSEDDKSTASANGPSPSPLARKVPPRPPPKPKKRSANGPLYEDEGEDGTEV